MRCVVPERVLGVPSGTPRRTGGAWPSSARVVRCWVKSRNERNPCPVLPAGNAGYSQGTAGDKSEEGGDDVRSVCPLCPGLHRRYSGRDNGTRSRKVEQIPKTLSWCGLGVATHPHEGGIGSNGESAMSP